MSITYQPPYPAQDAPRIGVVYNSIGGFVEQGKQLTETAFGKLLDQCKASGTISADSVIYPDRIFGAHDAWKVADLFSTSGLDAIVIVNSAFPCGHVLPIIGMAPHLRHLPLVVAAYEEPNEPLQSCLWVTNAICGSDMNKHDARRLGRYARYLAGQPGSEDFDNEFCMLMNVYRCVKKLSRTYVGRFGDGPGGFHSATGDQLLFARVFGVAVETVDLLRVYRVFEEMATTGTAGEASFSDEDIRATVAEMLGGRVNLMRENDDLYRSARLYHALRAICRAEGFTAASLKCWPEIMQPPLSLSGCLPIAWATAKGDVAGFACEGDWPGAVLQAAAHWLSGRPAAFLDFVDWTAKSDVVRFGHCGVGLAGCMAPNDPALLARIEADGGVTPQLREDIAAGQFTVNDAINYPHNIPGKIAGHIGQFEYGPKTGIDLIQTAEGGLEMLAFEGESAPATARGVLYAGCDMRIDRYKALDEIKRTRGFSHHLVVALKHILPELQELCTYYGIDLLTPGA